MKNSTYATLSSLLEENGQGTLAQLEQSKKIAGKGAFLYKPIGTPRMNPPGGMESGKVT